jgi:hypothetical protein
MIHNDILTATTCDHVFEASYCVKTVGLYGGTSFIICIVCACACCLSNYLVGLNNHP